MGEKKRVPESFQKFHFKSLPFSWQDGKHFNESTKIIQILLKDNADKCGKYDCHQSIKSINVLFKRGKIFRNFLRNINNDKKKNKMIVLPKVTFIFNRFSKGGVYTVRLYVYFLMFVHRYFFEQ